MTGSTATPPDDSSGRRSALIIGAATFEDTAFGSLTAPPRDVVDLAAVLADPHRGGFAVATLIDPTFEGAQVAIEEFLSQRSIDETVLVYFSGHGVRDLQGMLYFAAANSRRNLLAATAVGAEWLLARLDDCAARSQILILDCCFSGAFTSRRAKGDGGSDRESRTGLDDVFGHRGRGRAILTASRSYEKSYEGDSLPNGDATGSVYTTGLVDGVRTGAADTDGDGYISVLDAHEHACRYVARVRVDQTPQSWLYGAEGRLLLARSPRVRASVDVSDRLPSQPGGGPMPEIFRLEPADLGTNCVIPYALDDQWVPRSLIRAMAAEKKSLHELGERRTTLVRREYMRALLSARKIVINRSYLLKNPVLNRDYRSDPVSRAAFVELLRDGVIVPYLYKEMSPVESAFASDPDAAEGARIWNALLDERDPDGHGSVALQCVRLSWDQNDNERLVQERLTDAFADGIRRAAQLDRRRLLADARADASDTFSERLRLLPKSSGSTDRTAMYRRYVVRDGTSVADGRYDFRRSDMVALKWLFDLIYNSGLATALGLAMVTPADSAHQSAVTLPGRAPAHGLEGEAARLRTTVMEAVQGALFVHDQGLDALKIFDGLTLSDVVAIRNGDAWRAYAQSLDDLLAEPWLMSHPERGLPFVYGRYAALIDAITGITASSGRTA